MMLSTEKMMAIIQRQESRLAALERRVVESEEAAVRRVFIELERMSLVKETHCETEFELNDDIFASSELLGEINDLRTEVSKNIDKSQSKEDAFSLSLASISFELNQLKNGYQQSQDQMYAQLEKLKEHSQHGLNALHSKIEKKVLELEASTQRIRTGLEMNDKEIQNLHKRAHSSVTSAALEQALHKFQITVTEKIQSEQELFLHKFQTNVQEAESEARNLKESQLRASLQQVEHALRSDLYDIDQRHHTLSQELAANVNELYQENHKHLSLLHSMLMKKNKEEHTSQIPQHNDQNNELMIGSVRCLGCNRPFRHVHDRHATKMVHSSLSPIQATDAHAQPTKKNNGAPHLLASYPGGRAGALRSIRPHTVPCVPIVGTTTAAAALQSNSLARSSV